MTHLPTSIRTFSSVEELDELPRELGWPLEYRQIKPGSFSSTFTDIDSDSWFLMEEQSSQTVEVEGGAPDGMYLLALAEGGAVAVNGKILKTDHIFLQTPGSDFRAILPAGTRVTQIGFAAEQFKDVVHAVAPDLSVPRREAMTLEIAPGGLAGMRHVMRAAIQAPSRRAATRDEVASGILADLIGKVSGRGQVKIVRDLHRAAARRALDRAKDYIEAHLSEAIRVESLCRYVGATQRSVQRAFARELGISPQQYVLARRLNAVRRNLLAADREQDPQVTDMAEDYGFSHMGRFAGQYRRYFGESPSETLQLSR